MVTKIQLTQHDRQEEGGTVGGAGGGATEEPVSGISKETPKDTGADHQQKSAPEVEPIQKEAEPIQKGAESIQKGTKSTQQGVGLGQKSADSHTHAIDPMTLSLIPMGITAKSASPVMGDNPASATPTSKGTTPTSARQLIGTHSGNTGTGRGGNTGLTSMEPDLMSFSISPAILKGMASTQPLVAMPVNGGHQLESSPAEMDTTSENLIEFSLTPAQLGMARNSAMYNSGSKYRQLFQQPPLSTGPIFPPLHSGSQFPTQPGSHSHSKMQGRQAHSHSPDHTGSHSSSSVANEVRLHPNWEHFSDESLKPVCGAPQKLISKVGGSGFSSHGNEEETNMNKSPVDGNIEKAWTVVSMLSGGPLVETGDSPALRQLQRVASQPGFNEVGGANVIGAGPGADPSIGEFMLHSVAINGDSNIGNTLKATEKSGRGFSPLLPMPDGNVGRADQLLLGDFPSVPEVGRDLASRHKAGPGMLLDDLEFAFPNADSMFPGSTSAKADGAKVKVVDDKNFDYAQLDLPTLGKVGVAKDKGRNENWLDYAVLKSEEPRYEFQEFGEEDAVKSKVGEIEKVYDYSELVDVTVDFRRDTNNPIGGDPLYSVPDKTKRTTRQHVATSKTSNATPGPAGGDLSTPIGQDPNYAVPNKVWLKGGMVASKGVGSHGQLAGGGAQGQRNVGRAEGQRSETVNVREQMPDMLAGEYTSSETTSLF